MFVFRIVGGPMPQPHKQQGGHDRVHEGKYKIAQRVMHAFFHLATEKGEKRCITFPDQKQKQSQDADLGAGLTDMKEKVFHYDMEYDSEPDWRKRFEFKSEVPKIRI